MAKSKFEQLREAILANDMEKAEKLAAQLHNEHKKKAAKPKMVPAPTPSGTVYGDETGIAPSRQPNAGKTVFRDGKEYTACSFGPVKLTGENKYVDDKQYTDPKLKKLDDQLKKKFKPSPRRDKARQIETNCEDCGRKFTIYESELLMGHTDDASAYTYYRCDRCIGRRK